MSRNAASQRQMDAARPEASTWLSANAGSGKTRVLTDRVARLLLSGTEPQRILCLTYTKAAASEMQNRLFRRLGDWAMLEEGELRRQLADLGVEGAIGPDTLASARRLFARAIETPGGLKIQTIHSFCAGLLRRFPLEAGVPPGFTEMDDRAAELMRSEIVEELAGGLDVAAVDALARLTGSDDIARLLAAFCSNSDAFSEALDRDQALALFDLPPGYDRDALVSEVLLGGEEELIAGLIPVLAGSGANDQKAAEKLSALDFGVRDPSLVEGLEGVLLTGASAKVPHGAKIGAFPTKGLREGPCAGMMPRLEALMARVETARPKRLALAAAERSLSMHRFAAAFLPRYHAAKAARGWLDFDDLIKRAAALLSDRSVAQWVLFRLDGGIDHILVDEAQDTSPGQWAVIERLSEEFTSGEGATETPRTIFVVGDKKQSIYSFQGADLDAFDRMRRHFGGKYAAVGAEMQDMSLDHSFRSSAAVLKVVDETFAPRAEQGIGGAPLHIAFNEDLPGRVELWPLVETAAPEEEDDWDDPVDRLAETHHSVELARKIAEWIARKLADGTRLPTRDGSRPMHAGDVLILVQRRSDLFAEIIAACKSAGLPIAGADRLKLGAEMAVKDIRALLSFLATPEDDLSLAAALRSPLFGWSEDELFRLAQPREGYLWAALRKAPGHEATRAVLDDLRRWSDFLRPFELIERLLTRHGGRARLVARLGAEAEDGIDELLTQSLAFERSEVPSLTGFLVWLEGGDVEVKRSLDSGGRAIRVMTVHGSKGLEAPVVIMPDTIRREATGDDQIVTLDSGSPAWNMAQTEAPEALAAARGRLKARVMQERDRLLYVAMTRAECWLVVCGAGDPGKAEQWWQMVADAMGRLGAERGPDGVLRLGHGDWPAAEPGKKAEDTATLGPDLPSWTRHLPPPPVLPEAALSPTGLGGSKVMPGDPAGEDAAAPLETEAALRRGRQMHLLLEHLDLWPEAERRDNALRLLGQGEDATTDTEAQDILAAAETVLSAPELAAFRGPEALSEVEIVARLPELGGRLLHGTIDRLLVSGDEVLALDWKSNALVPATASEVPEGYLRQMAAYHAALSQGWPGRRIRVGIYWSARRELMWIPDEILRNSLNRAQDVGF